MKFIPLLLIFFLILSIWLLPSVTPALGVALIVISLSLALFSVFKKHHTAYLQGKLTRAVFLHNTFLDMFGILLAVVLAGLLGRYLAEMVTQPIGNDTAKVIIGIIIGLLVGIGAGLLVNRTWGYFVKAHSM